MSGIKRTIFRRESAKISAVVLTAASIGASQEASAQTPASELESEFLLELVLDVDSQIDAGHTSIAPVAGGTFSGPRISGTVHPGGAEIDSKDCRIDGRGRNHNEFISVASLISARVLWPATFDEGR